MKKIALGSALLVATAPVLAVDLDQLQNLGQTQFQALSEDLGSALSYKALAPAEPLGLLGFDIGVEVTSTTLENKDAVNAAFSGSELSALPVAKVHAHKGLPFGIDVGASYTSVPGSNIKVMGAELRYAILDGSTVMPAVAVRGTMSKLSGVDQLDLSTTGVELSISKGFLMLTPYAGVGQVWVTSTPNDVTGLGNIQLKKEEFTQTKSFVGANLNLGLLNFAFEMDKTGDASTVGAKFGFRF